MGPIPLLKYTWTYAFKPSTELQFIGPKAFQFELRPNFFPVSRFLVSQHVAIAVAAQLEQERRREEERKRKEMEKKHENQQKENQEDHEDPDGGGAGAHV